MNQLTHAHRPIKAKSAKTGQILADQSISILNETINMQIIILPIIKTKQKIKKQNWIFNM